MHPFPTFRFALVFLAISCCLPGSITWAQVEREDRFDELAQRIDVMPRPQTDAGRTGWPKRTGQDGVRGSEDLYDQSVYRTLELTFTDTDWHQQLLDNWETHDSTGEDIYVKADLEVDGVVYPEVGVQYKGNSSFWFVDGFKKPYKITMDAFVEDQELYGYDKITLNNGVFDPTLMREIICYTIMGKFMPAPRANLVRIRSGLAGDLMDIGVYVSVERVNKRFMGKHFEVNSGHRYKANSGSLTWLGSDPASYEPRYSVSGGDSETEYLDLIEVIDQLNNSDLADLRSNLDPVLSIDRAIRQITAGYALLNWDDLRAFAPNGHNYYLYQNDFHQQMTILPWDWDLGLSGSANEDIYDLFNNTNIPLVNRLMSIPELRERYLAFLKMYNEELLWSEIETWVTQLRNHAEDDILGGIHELFSDAEYHQSQTELQNTITGRHQFLNDHADLNKPRPSIANVMHSPAKPDQNNAVSVLATVTGTAPIGSVLLYYRSLGAFVSLSMADDGVQDDGVAGNGIYGASIPPQSPGRTVSYYIEAATDAANGGALWFEPILTEHRPLTFEVAPAVGGFPVVINEFVAKNDNGIVDEEGKFEDWLELYNSGTEDVNLEGYFLTDDLAEPMQWAMPDVVIPAGGYLLIWCDEDLDDGPLHADFKLSTNGESIGFFSPVADGNQQLDAFTFGEQTADVSQGRETDGDPNWVFFDIPTPRRSNSTILGDLNSDQRVDCLDFARLVNDFGACADPCSQTCPGDLNGDCMTDETDLATCMGFWNY